MNSLVAGLFVFAILVGLTSYFAYDLNGGKVYIACGIGMEILGFTYILAGRNIVRISDYTEFWKIFQREDKDYVGEIEVTPKVGKTAFGTWLVLLGLTVQLIGLFLI